MGHPHNPLIMNSLQQALNLASILSIETNLLLKIQRSHIMFKIWLQAVTFQAAQNKFNLTGKKSQAGPDSYGLCAYMCAFAEWVDLSRCVWGAGGWGWRSASQYSANPSENHSGKCSGTTPVVSAPWLPEIIIRCDRAPFPPHLSEQK